MVSSAYQLFGLFSVMEGADCDVSLSCHSKWESACPPDASPTSYTHIHQVFKRDVILGLISYQSSIWSRKAARWPEVDKSVPSRSGTEDMGSLL